MLQTKEATHRRSEVFCPSFFFSKKDVKAKVEGFTEGKQYDIKSEYPDINSLGMIYHVTDDDGKERKINSFYFISGEPYLWAPKELLVEDTLDVRKEFEKITIERDFQVSDEQSCLAGVKALGDCQKRSRTDKTEIRTISLYEKVKFESEKIENELGYLAGLRPHKKVNGFKVMEDALNKIRHGLEESNRLLNSLSTEIEVLKRTHVIE